MDFKVQEKLTENDILYIKNKVKKFDFKKCYFVDGMKEINFVTVKDYFQMKEGFKIVVVYHMITNGNNIKIKYFKDQIVGSEINFMKADVLAVEVPYYKQEDFEKQWRYLF